MIENLPALLCVASIGVFFVFPMWLYIYVTERRNRSEREQAIEAGRHEPVTIQPYVDLGLCMGAGACVTACPENVLRLIDGQAVAVNMSACIGHGVCVPVCPVDAIQLVFGSDKRGIDIPEVGAGFETNVKGLYIAGELGGMGLIAAAAEQGVQAMQAAAAGIQKRPGRKDVIIVGAGPAGLAAALVAKQKGLDYLLVDQGEVGGVVRHYPRKKLVFIRPLTLPLYGKVNLKQLYKEELVDLFVDVVKKCGIEVSGNERVEGVAALPDGGFAVKTVNRTVEGQRVILALGRGGTPRKLDVPGEEQEKVSYSLLEPEHFQNEHVVVVGGGDSAVEAAMQLGEQPGNKVLLSYRGDKINRPKEKNIKRLKDAVKKGQVELLLSSTVKEIGEDRIVLDQQGEVRVLPNDHVFVFAGGILPTKFLQDAGIKIRKHYGKRVVDADADAAKGKEGKRAAEAPKGEAPARPPSEAAPPRPPAPPPVPVPPPADGSAETAVLPDHRVDELGGEDTVPRPAPDARPSEESTVPRAPPLELAPLREDTNPEGSPRLGDLPTALVDPAALAAATAPDEPYDETPLLPPEAEAPRGRREVTEIKSLRRVATLGADRSAAPRAGAARRALGRDRARRRQADRAGGPLRPPPRRPPPEPAGPTGLSRGISRAGRGPGLGSRVPEASQGPVAEVRPTTRRDAPSGKVKLPDPRRQPPPEPRAPAPPSAVDPFLSAADDHLSAGRFAEVLQMTQDLMGLVERAAASLPDADRASARRRVLELDGRAPPRPRRLGVRAAVARGGRRARPRDVRRPRPRARAARARPGAPPRRPLRRGPRRVVRSLLAARPGRRAPQLPPPPPRRPRAPRRGARRRRALVRGGRARRRPRRPGPRPPRPRPRRRRPRGARRVPRPARTGRRPARRRRARPRSSPGSRPALSSSRSPWAATARRSPRAEDLAHTTARAASSSTTRPRPSRSSPRCCRSWACPPRPPTPAGQVDALARHLGPRGAEARIRGRARRVRGRPATTSRCALLEAVGPPAGRPRGRPRGPAPGRARPGPWCAAIRARARELAHPPSSRAPSPRLVIRSARIRLDGALALLEAGAPSSARSAVKRGAQGRPGLRHARAQARAARRDVPVRARSPRGGGRRPVRAQDPRRACRTTARARSAPAGVIANAPRGGGRTRAGADAR
jgi:thioredoxin reductase (NADPH)